MGISTLGKSLLSSAKKKAKRGQQLGLFAGAAIGVVGAVNKGIRAKAEQRANEWNKSWTPVRSAYENEFKIIKGVQTDKEARDAFAGGYKGSFVSPEITRLTDLTPGGKSKLTAKQIETIRTTAAENVADDILKYETQVELYSPYFNIDSKKFMANVTAVQKKGGELISDDSLKKKLGRLFCDSNEGQRIKESIKLSDNNYLSVDVPQEMYQALDLDFLKDLDGMKTREAKVSEIEIIPLPDYLTSEQISIFQASVRRTEPVKALTDKVFYAVQDIFTMQVKDPQDDTKVIANENYLASLTFKNKDNQAVQVPIETLKNLLSLTYDGGKENIPGSENNFSDWDQYKKDTAMLTQKAELKYLDDYPEQQVTPQDRSRWAAKSAVEAANLFQITFEEGVISDTWKPFDEVRGDVPVDVKFNVVNVEDDYPFNKEKLMLVISTPEWKATAIEDQFNFFNSLKAQHPNSVKEIAAMQRALSENKPLEEAMQETLLEDMTRLDGTKKSATGFKGPITNNVDGSTMTEVSVNFDDVKNPYSNKNLIPIIVPTLTDEEISMLQDMEIEGNAKNIPQSIKDKAISHANVRLESGLNPFYQDGEEETDTTISTKTPAKSLLSSTVPTQEDLVKEFEILGADKMSPTEIDERLNDMINRKADFTTDEYIKLITYLNSKQGIMPQPTSLLESSPELTDSEIIANALKGSGTGRNPLEVIDDMNTRNSIRNTNLGLKTLERKTTTARQAVATSGLLRNEDFVEFLESEGTTEEEFNTTTKDYVLNIFTKYLEQLKAK